MRIISLTFSTSINSVDRPCPEDQMGPIKVSVQSQSDSASTKATETIIQ